MNRQRRRQEVRSVRRAKRPGDPLDLGLPSVTDLFQRGFDDHRAGRLLRAQAAYRQILTVDPAHADAHNNLGNTLRDLGRPAEAEASYREALRLRPNDPEAHNNLGNALCDLGRPAEAEASIERALALKPDYAEALYARGTSLHALNRWRESIACFERLLSLTPHDLATKLALCMAELPILYA